MTTFMVSRVAGPVVRGFARFGLAAVIGALTIVPAGAQQAAKYPSRPITLITPYAVGGDSDLAARNFAAAATRALGQTVLVMNRPGASGTIGSQQVLQAAPDGYTLLLARPGSQAILPAIMPSLTKYKWDDFTFIGTLEINAYGCMVSGKSNYKSFDDLVKALRTRGKAMNFGTAGVLTTNDMGPRQLFKVLKLTDQTPTQVPYKATSEAATSLMTGETDFACGSLGTFVSGIKSGQLRALMVTTPERMASFPDVPTARELGYADMEAIVGWSAVFGPPNLPADVKERLVAALKAVAEDTGWQTGTANSASVPFVRSPEETRDFILKQHQLYRGLGELHNLIDKVQL
ncbi:MAG TPA: tripartite tricarboxylate transporter substrate binding protein [Burkholderiaceae bacterium]|nr:tripartite tricarboxylate transporter substrate binding protein [Burkholderiaceae bacterium]